MFDSLLRLLACYSVPSDDQHRTILLVHLLHQLLRPIVLIHQLFQLLQLRPSLVVNGENGFGSGRCRVLLLAHPSQPILPFRSLARVRRILLLLTDPSVYKLNCLPYLALFDQLRELHRTLLNLVLFLPRHVRLT